MYKTEYLQNIYKCSQDTHFLYEAMRFWNVQFYFSLLFTCNYLWEKLSDDSSSGTETDDNP